VALARATAADPWDGRASREKTFVAKLKAAAPASPVRDLDPPIDALRAIKSPREIAVIREATRLAGLGIVEAMRDARPGLVEYQLQADAELVFKDGGAYGPAYFALIAAGPNPFTDRSIRAAATQFVDGYRTRRDVTSLGHAVGMEVHDVGGPPATLEPGMVFTIEPAMQLPDEHLGIRLEDMILITDAGYENVSASVPIEIDEIERTMQEPGLRSARPRQ